MPEDLPPEVARFANRVQRALKHWHSLRAGPDDRLADLLLVQDQLRRHPDDDGPAAQRRAANTVLLTALEDLQAEHSLESRVLHSRFVDRNKGLATANQLNLSLDQVNRLQKSGLHHLAELLLRREAVARAARWRELEAQLEPAQYTQLYGIDETCQALTEALHPAAAPWVISVVGLGGIGKTALADAAARRVLPSLAYSGAAWIRLAGVGQADPKLAFEHLIAAVDERLFRGQADPGSPDARLRRVRQRLKADPHLIVVDNLEVEAETDYLLERLADLAAPSKFLLTTRTRPSGRAATLTLSLDELPPGDAARLLRRHGVDIGYLPLAEAPRDDLDAIYQVVGGNPLALRLVASLVVDQPLPQVLADLRRSRPGSIEDLYRRIYWRVWRGLTPAARQLLQAMPLTADVGGEVGHLQAASTLTDADLWPAIHELASRSLLEVRGGLHARRYGIHRLTETFLQTEINLWSEAAG